MQVAQDSFRLCGHKRAGQVVDGRDAPRILHGDSGDGRRRIASQRRDGFDVGLYASPARGVGTGDAQDNGRRLHGQESACCSFSFRN